MGRLSHTDRIKTDDGYHLVRYVQVGEVEVIRRDDLRGVWWTCGGMYATRDAALEAAEAFLDAAMDGEPVDEEDVPFPDPEG